MDLTMVYAVGFVLVAIAAIVAMFLSYLESAFNGEIDRYSNDSYYKYEYDNPLKRWNSKYFHYRPAGAVVLTRNKWLKIEEGIRNHVYDVRTAAVKEGRRQLMQEIRAKLTERRSSFESTNPYDVLGVDATASLDEMKEKWYKMRGLYNPHNFVDLDPSFVELATIRVQQIDGAWRLVKRGKNG
jgi:hypothetical protein